VSSRPARSLAATDAGPKNGLLILTLIRPLPLPLKSDSDADSVADGAADAAPDAAAAFAAAGLWYHLADGSPFHDRR